MNKKRAHDESDLPKWLSAASDRIISQMNADHLNSIVSTLNAKFGIKDPMATMKGTRPAALNWQRELTRVLAKIGFVSGRASPCTFSHTERGISLFVHRDDFLSSGTRQDFEWLRNMLAREWTIKSSIIGNDDDKGNDNYDADHSDRSHRSGERS